LFHILTSLVLKTSSNLTSTSRFSQSAFSVSTCHDSFLRYRRYINHLRSYLLTYLLNIILVTIVSTSFGYASACLRNQLPVSVGQPHVSFSISESPPPWWSHRLLLIHYSHHPYLPQPVTPGLKAASFTNPSHHRLTCSPELSPLTITRTVTADRRWLYWVECPQCSVRLEALGYLKRSRDVVTEISSRTDRQTQTLTLVTILRNAPTGEVITTLMMMTVMIRLIY